MTPPRRGPLVAGVLSLVLVLVVAGAAFLLLRDDTGTTEDPGPAVAAPSSSSTVAPEPERPDPLDDPMSTESIDLRYEALGGSVTTGSDGCRDAKARQGQQERLVCDLGAATLELVTYTTFAGLTARRDRADTDEPGTVQEPSTDGRLLGFESQAPEQPQEPAKPKKGKPAQGTAEVQTFLYTDDKSALQSGWLTAEAGTDLSVLVRAYTATDPTRPYPTGPTNKKIVSFVKRWAKADQCLRIPSVNPGALEENYCDVKGPVQMFVGRFGSMDDLETYRTIIVASAEADDRDVREWDRGTLYEYQTDDDTVVRYWDDPSCLCYAEAFLAQGTYDQLATWWDEK